VDGEVQGTRRNSGMPGMRLLELESVLFDGKGSVCCGGCGDVGGEKLRDLLQGEVCGKESTIVY